MVTRYTTVDSNKVKDDIKNLQYIKNQTPEICMAAVKQDGTALQFVKEQTEKNCKAAVNQNTEASKFIKIKI